MTKYILVTLLLLVSIVSSAQHVKIINKDFSIEEYNSVEFDLYGETTYQQWEADYILVETTAKLWDIPKRLFTQYVGKGRYFCELKSTNAGARISAVPVERNKLVTRESVVSVVYYPKSFAIHDSKIVRQESMVSSKEEKEEK